MAEYYSQPSLESPGYPDSPQNLHFATIGTILGVCWIFF